MPITAPAHQLVVVPFLRAGSPLPGAALLIGSALLDEAYVFGGYGANAASHTVYGPLVMAPTLGLLLQLWLVVVIAPGFSQALPAQGRWPLARLCATRGVPRSLGAVGWSVLALLIGAYSHWLLDGLTHAWMWPARVLYPDVQVGGFKLARLLQIGGSVLLSVGMLVWMVRAARRLPEIGGSARWRRNLARIGLTALAGAALGIAAGLLARGVPGDSRRTIWLFMSPMLAGLLLGTTAAAWTLRRPRKAP